MKKISKYILLLVYSMILWLGFISDMTYASNSFQIIPEPRADSQADIDKAISDLNSVYDQSKIESEWKTDFWTEYNEAWKNLDGDLGAQLKTGIFTWESLLNIGTYIIRFLMQIAMVIWAWFIIRWWYQSVLVAFGAGKADEWRKYIKNIFIWVVIIAFSYTIIQLLVMAFLS